MYAELVILTKSSKNKGYCVAGIDINNGQWIRLTSDDKNTHGTLFPKDMQYENESECQTLDVVRVQILGENPSEYQPENVLINQDYYWKKTDEYTIDDVLKLHPPERHSYIFGNTLPYITESEIGSIGYSLTLVAVEKLLISKKINRYGKPKTKTDFLYGSNWYNEMSVTDPNFYGVPDGTRISKAALVISIPDNPFQGDFSENRYYKFVAQIYEF
ncbi:MAG: hypothetical protein FWC91_08975 [Defluviitaleaceae bacterium]|nr:hypothetical protein [Defluviitaleaceae bacterium]